VLRTGDERVNIRFCVLGEMALLDAPLRGATATARSAGGMVRVDKRKCIFLVHEHPTFALQVMAIMAERLRRANEHA
jgi:CRP-like cAMP-binding protein